MMAGFRLHEEPETDDIGENYPNRGGSEMLGVSALVFMIYM